MVNAISGLSQFARNTLLPLCRDHFADPVHGGFHERLGANLKPVATGRKRLMVQVRQFYVLSHAAVLGDRSGTAVADRGYEFLLRTLYCARGQAENLIKLHKSQLASDRTSCRSALANQVRLVLHTAAYWLMLTVRDAIPKSQPLASAEFATLRMRLLKIAGRITETATRVRVAFAATCPEAELFRGVARRLHLAGP